MAATAASCSAAIIHSGLGGGAAPDMQRPAAEGAGKTRGNPWSQPPKQMKESKCRMIQYEALLPHGHDFDFTFGPCPSRLPWTRFVLHGVDSHVAPALLALRHLVVSTHTQQNLWRQIDDNRAAWIPAFDTASLAAHRSTRPHRATQRRQRRCGWQRWRGEPEQEQKKNKVEGCYHAPNRRRQTKHL